MLSETLSQTNLTLLPLVALVIFALVFVGVVIRVWRRGAHHPTDERAALLPLSDDAMQTSPPACCNGGHDDA